MDFFIHALHFPHLFLWLSHSLSLSPGVFRLFLLWKFTAPQGTEYSVDTFKLKTHVFHFWEFFLFYFFHDFITTIFSDSFLECCWSGIWIPRCTLSMCFIFFSSLNFHFFNFFALEEFLNVYSSHSVEFSLFQELFFNLFFFLHNILLLFVKSLKLNLNLNLWKLQRFLKSVFIYFLHYLYLLQDPFHCLVDLGISFSVWSLSSGNLCRNSYLRVRH